MEEFRCDICNRSFDAKESLKQHKAAKHQIIEKKANRKARRYVLLALLIVALGIFSYTFYIRAQMPGEFDGFAKCLSEKGVVIYGNDFCQYTARELNFFSNSKKYLSYVKCVENKELCDAKGVKITPTWEINGKMYEGVQGLQKLADLSGCKI